MRWLIVFLLACLLFNGLRGWLQRLGLGRLPGDFSASPGRPRVVRAAGQPADRYRLISGYAGVRRRNPRARQAASA
jgi:hypothetical protein